MLTSVGDFLGWAPLTADPPLWSLNAPYAIHGKPLGVGSPMQNGRLPHTQSSDILHTGSGSLLVSFSGPQRYLAQVPQGPKVQGRSSSVRVAIHPVGAGYLLYLSQ